MNNRCQHCLKAIAPQANTHSKLLLLHTPLWLIKMKTFLILILLLSNTITYGQGESDSTKTKGFFIYSIFEIPQIDTKDINETLASNGLPDFRLSPESLGLHFEFISNRFDFVIQWAASDKTFTYDTSSQTGLYASAGFNLGFNILKKKAYSITPNIGMKITDVQYKWSTLSSNPIGQVFFTQKNEYLEFTSTQYSLDLGVKLAVHKNTSAFIAFGYQIPLSRSMYTNNDALKLSEIPSINSSYYFTIGLGMGKYYTK